jgi:hypothetical protein
LGMSPEVLDDTYHLPGAAAAIGQKGRYISVVESVVNLGTTRLPHHPNYDNHRQPAPDEAPEAASGRKSFDEAGLHRFMAAKKQSIFEIARRHFAQTRSSTPDSRNERMVRNVGSAAFAFLSLVAVVACVGAAIALGQIKSLKSDIAMLHRELQPLRERLGKLEQEEKTKRDPQQQGEAQDNSGIDKNRPAGEIATDQTALNLSTEEIQVIRDYIKPAPSAGAATPAINIGDPIGGATIPLPSPVTEKVPKLAGARFTTRNGAIIISMRNSHRADAVLAPH